MTLEATQEYFIPEYMLDFRCIGKDCIDSCCVGWNIEIDKKTFKKYKDSSNKKIKLISQKHLVKKNLSSNIAYGRLQNYKNCCPLLSKEKLCNAYNLLGKESLSIGCSTFPRNIKIFDKIGFIAGELSCPEIARLCLNKSNLKISKLTKKNLSNIFNSNNIHSFKISKDLSDKNLKFIEKTLTQINRENSLFDIIKKTIFTFYEIYQLKHLKKTFSERENKKIRESNLLINANIFAKLCFRNLENNSRYKKICKKSASKSKYFEKSKKQFEKQFIEIYERKFDDFKKVKKFIFTNFFFNEFIKNVENIISSEEKFNNFIREIVLFLDLTNFLLVCQLFDETKELTINDYVEVLSSVVKQIQSSKGKTNIIINLFKKIDNNNLLKRLVDIY